MSCNAFNDGAVSYEKWFVENNLTYDTEVLAISSMIPKDKKGIEVGVGTGLFSSRLGIGIGVEPSENMAAIARQRGIDVISGYAENLPIDRDSFDYALMVTVDCFLDDLDKSYREIHRILKSEGQFILACIDKDTELGKVYQEHKEKDEFYKYANFHSADEICKIVCNAGFKLERKIQTVFDFENKKHDIIEGTGSGVFAVLKFTKI